ncbi:DNA repair endonuclease UVH1-like [Cucurbita pepo subsp. pepo]|uniref:DNA repair endonuclease UVH1-like n=1 Tax=Cucurbita pepo subsp. pepo TaxID=3664 RepID=UPI000C9D7FB5|nr:DNA repair endonuclease UVH1-like [Cucurbita pepo subsp. pepo]XP_023533840.1 DNA repair endonuclease UVH1-like [Cucurbita pepo subsp. pepo]
MVQFHEHIITELLEDSNGGLVIISSGLNLAKLVSSLLLLHSPAQGTLLLVSPSSHFQLLLKSQIIFYLKLHQSDSITFPSEITADLPAHHRLSLYSSGSAFFVTPRILIVDLLTNKLPTSNIAGIILLNAHSLSETSTEAFIVRIIRSHNRNAYVRVFSDKPHAMVSGFAKAERIMKCLYVRRLHLWPRFQVYVSEELERNPPDVVDIRVPMTKYMVGIQKAIIEVMDACLKEMRKTNKVDVEDLTVENGLFKSFDEIVRRQLDPIWHTLGKRTKQLVSDLKTLRKLLDYLVRYDAVTFLKYLDTLRVSESFRSVWIFAESSYKIFDYAKKRVYRIVRPDGSKIHEQGKGVVGKRRKTKGDDNNEEEGTTGRILLDEVLEEAPKWKVLREVLEEIEEERRKRLSEGEENLLESDKDSSGIVLVACKDERSCMQLEECIMNNPQKVLRVEWEKYLLNKIQLRDIKPHKKKKHKDPKGFGVLDGVVLIAPAENAEASSLDKQERKALLAAASEIRNRAKNDSAVEEDPRNDKDSTKQATKKRKGRSREGASKINNSVDQKPVDDQKVAIDDHQPDADNIGYSKGKRKLSKKDSVDVGDSNESKDKNVCNQKASINDKVEACVSGCEDWTNEENPGALDGFSEATCLVAPSHPEGEKGREKTKLLPPVHFYALESDQPILDTLKPSIVIVYHPDITFVRQIEVYKAENPSKHLKVYFLFYEDSTEVQKFQASIRRENSAFESLIRQKSLMMIPVDQNGYCLGINSSVEPLATTQNSTRKAGGRKDLEKEMQVIVDMREFMSSLPNVLHQKGMRIIPITLEVGDYILSPLICVERKSIQDLFMSFASGRLYHQVETMVRYYRIPVLLIEFSQDKSFSFQSASDIGDDLTPTNIMSKLSLLVLHFPRLRILWSRSLHATAEIFASLKANQDEPDETKAVRVGVPSEEGIVENDVRAENYNTSAVEFLRRLPGVTDSNYRAIMDGCKSLAELSLLPVEKLAVLMGGQQAARTLREFLDAKYPTLL